MGHYEDFAIAIRQNGPVVLEIKWRQTDGRTDSAYLCICAYIAAAPLLCGPDIKCYKRKGERNSPVTSYGSYHKVIKMFVSTYRLPTSQ